MSLFGDTCTVGGSQVLTHLLFLSPREQGISLGLKLYGLGGGVTWVKPKLSLTPVYLYLYICIYFTSSSGSSLETWTSTKFLSCVSDCLSQLPIGIPGPG